MSISVCCVVLLFAFVFCCLISLSLFCLFFKHKDKWIAIGCHCCCIFQLMWCQKADQMCVVGDSWGHGQYGHEFVGPYQYGCDLYFLRLIMKNCTHVRRSRMYVIKAGHLVEDRWVCNGGVRGWSEIM